MPKTKKKIIQGNNFSRCSEATKRILLVLSVPFVVSVTPYTTAPCWVRNFMKNMNALENKLFPPQFQEEEKDEDKIRQSLHTLKSRGYITYKVSRDGLKITYELTEKGKDLMQRHKIEEMDIPKERKWDGKWRFVMFDIPEKHRRSRDLLRKKLQKFEFFRLQQSVWVFPYPCEKEISFLCEYFNIKDNVLVFTGEVNADKKLKEYFREKGFEL